MILIELSMSANPLLSYLYPILLYYPIQRIYNIYIQITIPSKIEEGPESVPLAPGRPSVAETLKEEIEPFLDQNGIMKNITFCEIDKRDFSAVAAAAVGSNLFKGAFIFLTQGFYEADKEACKFVVKHEIGHIKHNDCITAPSIKVICDIASICFGLATPSFSLIHIIILAEIVSIIAESIIKQFQEAKADDFAIEHSSNQELAGGIRIFTALQEKYIEKRNAHLWNRIFFSSSGENRLDILHPSIASRLQKIQDALRTRRGLIDLINQPNLRDLKPVLFA